MIVYTRIASNDNPCNISVSTKESTAVSRAAVNLSNDLYKICGSQCSVHEEDSNVHKKIIIGTIGISDLIDAKISDGSLKVDVIKKTSTNYHWEGFVLQELGGTLYIIGADRRGTVFGVYEFCRIAGVSPWHYFADVPVKKKNRVEVKENFHFSDYPSVALRGIFINDEEELDAWSKKHTKDGTIGPEVYEHIFELLLRLKANYIWPAMHVNYFNENPVNGKLAEEMGIIVGSSHCDMLLRSNQNEWQPWLEKKDYTNLEYDYSIKGLNRDRLKTYWRESIEMNKDYEVCYTLGMRGIHDSRFLTSVIDADITLDEAGRTKAKIALLEKIFEDQRGLIQEVLGKEQSEDVLQTFIPYKEAMLLYDEGLKVPDDVTFIWVDDNHGYMRRYPEAKDRQRSGGHGLYYHNSYWAPETMSYLFINSIPLAHTANELRKSYESGIRKMWVLNVGVIKPLEQDMEYFLQYGWEVGKKDTITEDPFKFTQEWIDGNFNGNHGKEAADIYTQFSQITNVRKVEHMDTMLFSQQAYGNEAGRRVKRLEELFHRANRIYFSLLEEEKEAFFQLFLMKIHVAYFVNSEYYFADRSTLSYERGNMKAADFYLDVSRDMMDYKRWMLHYYNQIMSHGKWDLILTPESFSPPVTAMYPDGKPALKIGEPELSVTLWGQKSLIDEGVLSFSRYGIKTKYIEIGNQGYGDVAYNIDIIEGKEWLSLSDNKGYVGTEKIIYLNFNDLAYKDGDLGKLQIRNPMTQNNYIVHIQVEKDVTIEDTFTGYVEADGFISMPATGFCKNISAKEPEIAWVVVPDIGRYQGDAMMAMNPDLCRLTEDVMKNPYMQYDFYKVNDTEMLLEIYRFLTLDSVGRIRFAISIDDADPIIVESEIRDEWLGNWKECVMDNGEKLKIKLPLIKRGHHHLKIYMIDHYVTLTKVVLYGESYMKSNIGPSWSYLWKGKTDRLDGLDHLSINKNQIEVLLKGIYGHDKAQVPLPKVLYQGKEYWDKDLCYSVCEWQKQKCLGPAKYTNSEMENGSKDLLQKFGKGIFNEENGVVAIEAEYALENSASAYLTKSKDDKQILWTHTQAETNGRTGLAMHVSERKLIWENPESAPGMHYKIKVHEKGNFHLWLLVRVGDRDSDSCYIGLDGEVQPLQDQLSQGNLFYFSTSRVFFWTLLSDLAIEEGEHVLSVLARKSRLRIDRIYLTQGEERPGVDGDWEESRRI